MNGTNCFVAVPSMVLASNRAERTSRQDGLPERLAEVVLAGAWGFALQSPAASICP